MSTAQMHGALGRRMMDDGSLEEVQKAHDAPFSRAAILKQYPEEVQDRVLAMILAGREEELKDG